MFMGGGDERQLHKISVHVYHWLHYTLYTTMITNQIRQRTAMLYILNLPNGSNYYIYNTS